MISLAKHSKRTSFGLAAALIFSLFAQIATAAIPVPRLKPNGATLTSAPVPKPVTSRHLSSSDAALFRAALDAADRKSWTIVRGKLSQITDPTARDVLKWVIASRNPKASFKDLTYVVHNLPEWPRMTGIRAAAEGMIFDTRLSSQKTIDWFRGHDPVSGEGRAALARAHFARGNDAEGKKWLGLAWRASKLTRDRQRTIYKEFGNRLTQSDHAARADHLIWHGRSQFSKVNGLLPLMTSGQRALMDARMRVASNRSGMDAAISRVPASLKSDPGLLFERSRWRRRKQSKEYALPMYLAISAPPMTERGKTRLWREKKIMAYWAIEQKRYNDAYKLTQNHGMERGSGFAEAEFLAGWLALSKLGQPTTAKTHFTRLKNGVSFPVSLSRAHYWLGRTHEALGDYQSQIEYAEAIKYPNTFYGFLAGERLGGANLTVTLPYEHNPAHLRAEFESDPRIRAMHILGEAEHERYFTQFAFHLDDVLETREHLTLLAEIGKSYGYMKPSIRAAKQASRFQTMLTESGYPMPEAIMSLPPKFNKAFVLAIARQESEFNYKAVSHARAYGMMQMINATAKATARKHRIPYSRSRMTRDSKYSANLGAHHLHDLLNNYDGSYIMAAVAYNAGPHRVKKWVRTYGDPRKGEIDAVDWLESIPFSETRNYVQRVIENMQVYRARMNGNTATNRVYRDITVGAF